MSLYLSTTAKEHNIRTEILSKPERLLFISTLPLTHFNTEEEVRIDLLAINIKSQQHSTEQALEILTKACENTTKRIDKDAIKDWTKRRGFYGWKGVKYFLFEYEQFLKSSARSKRDKLDWDSFYKESYEEDYYSIEHVYPQKAQNEYWKHLYQIYTIRERNILKHSIGNLVPLSKSKNSSLSNHSFEDKKANQDNCTGFAYGCYSENEVALEKDWSAKEILSRGIKLMCFMEDRWGIQLGSNRDKIKLLGLDFVVRKTPEINNMLEQK
jgi:hypothetical protein